ncbi:MAG: hypothetical protein IPP38_10570 [Bacteroidetes bacterium]|nr:hypothetical protein [Bacteroidota bacterium]
MGDLNDIKIISMSIGTPFSSGTLKDGVTYAYNKGKLIFAAAGTSFSWTSWWGVIYPAALSQCQAVTGVTESSSTCSDCHDGSQVDFTIPMQRNGNSNRTSLSLAPSGFNPTYIGGSSCATAITAEYCRNHLVGKTNPDQDTNYHSYAANRTVLSKPEFKQRFWKYQCSSSCRAGLHLLIQNTSFSFKGDPHRIPFFISNTLLKPSNTQTFKEIPIDCHLFTLLHLLFTSETLWFSKRKTPVPQTLKPFSNLNFYCSMDDSIDCLGYDSSHSSFQTNRLI